MNTKILSTITHIALDMDGVLWRGDVPMPSLVPAFEGLHSLGLPVACITNNSTRTLNYYEQKFAHFGITITQNQIITSAAAAKDHVQAHHPHIDTVFIVGDEGLHGAFKAYKQLSLDEVSQGAHAPLVIAGLCRNITYEWLSMASVLIQAGAHFIGTNPDVSFPTPEGKLPGAGSLLALLTSATGVTPTIIGKPHKPMFQEALKRLGSHPEHTLMVGDRLDTDIQGAQAVGMRTCLVLSGITEQDDLLESPIQPDIVLPDIGELATQLQHAKLSSASS